MAETGASLDVRIADFRWFREILIRGGDLVDVLADEVLSDAAVRRLRQFEAVLTDPAAEQDLPASG